MRTVSAAHQAHLDTGALTDKHLVTITRQDGVVKRLTDFDADITAGGNTFTGRYCTVGAMTWESGQSPFSMDIDFVVGGSSPIAEADVVAGYYERATVDVSLVNFDDPTQSTAIATGFIGDIAYDDAGNFKFDLVGLWSVAAMLRVRTFGPGCQTELGHPTWCKVPVRPDDVERSTHYDVGDHVRKSSDGTASGYQNRMFECTTAGDTASGAVAYNYTVGGTTTDGTAVFTAREAWTRFATVASVVDAFAITLTITEPRAVDDWFTRGAGKWITGNNAGWAFVVRKWTQATATVEFWAPLRGTVQVGDTLEIHVGCDLTDTTCNGRFANIVHFGGFPHLGANPQGGPA